MAEMTRDMIVQLGLTAMQAGIETPEQLEEYINRGFRAETLAPMVEDGLQRAYMALRGLLA